MKNIIKSIQRRKLVVGLLFLLAIVSIAFVFTRHTSHAAAPSFTNTPEGRHQQEAYWQTEIKTVGGAKAYKEFGAFVAPLSSNTKHALAHIFGGALYRSQGESALAVCDAQFSYGCFHEFLASAIEEHGISEVQTLNEDCWNSLVSSPLACQHGIGHGVLGYFGYGSSSLDKALSLCKDLPMSDSIGGCYGGVFMEYNMRTMLDYNDKVRPVTDNDIYAPCDTLADEYKKACVFWQPQWWLVKVYGNKAGVGVFTKMGKNCDTIGKDTLLKRLCYEGLGTVAPLYVDNSPTKAASFCNAASTEALYKLYCLSYAANDISLVAGASEGAKVCAGLTGASAEYCSAYAANTSNVALPHEPPLL